MSRWAKSGELPCIVTLGGHRRFRRADIDRIRGRMDPDPPPVDGDPPPVNGDPPPVNGDDVPEE